MGWQRGEAGRGRVWLKKINQSEVCIKTQKETHLLFKKIQKKKEEKTRDEAMENLKQKHSETGHPSMRERKFQDKNIK